MTYLVEQGEPWPMAGPGAGEWAKGVVEPWPSVTYSHSVCFVLKYAE